MEVVLKRILMLPDKPMSANCAKWSIKPAVINFERQFYMRNYSLLLLLIFVFGCQTRNAESDQINPFEVYDRLDSLNIQLKIPEKPIANYVNAVSTKTNLVFMAGKGPRDANGDLITGKIGTDLTVEEGYAAARRVAILQLEALQAEIGDLNKVKRIVKVLGMVNCHSDFTRHPEVINGFSDLMVAVFGEKGKHARAAVGMSSLPRDIAVEIEMIVEIN